MARSPWVASAGLCAPTAVASAVRGRHGPGWRGPRPRPAPGHPWVSPEVCRKCSRRRLLSPRGAQRPLRLAALSPPVSCRCLGGDQSRPEKRAFTRCPRHSVL